MIDQILQNSSDNIDIEVYKDGSKVDVDAGTHVSVTITNPNGVVLYRDTTATRHSLGRYYITLAADKTTVLGTYTAVWSFTISSTVMEHTQTFEVVSAVKDGYLLPDEYRSMTTLDLGEKTNTQLNQYIMRATYLIESYLGGSVRTATYSEQVRCVIDYVNEGIHIQLKHAPVQSVTSCSVEFSSGEDVDLTVDSIRIISEPGYLEYFSLSITTALTVSVRDLSHTTVNPMATVVYTAGYDEIPERVEMATVRLVDQLINIETKEFKSLASFGADNYNESYKDTPGQFELGKIGGDEVVELLRGYRHPVKKNLMII